jgi:enoyl-CoA hydratase/carnithine racemase
VWNLRQRGAVATLAFDAPPANELSLEGLAELDALLQEVAQDDVVSVVVLGSDRPGTFIAHADRRDVVALRSGAIPPESFERWLWTLLRVESLPQPVVAAVDGQAWGGGCELSLACTFRVCSPQAHFAQHEITRGAIPGAGGTQRLPRLVGPAHSARMVLTGCVVDATEALRIGLVDALLEADDFMGAVQAWIEPLADKPRASLIAGKRALVEGSRMPLLDGLRHEQRLFRDLLAGIDAADPNVTRASP